jgi:hypothetical protein
MKITTKSKDYGAAINAFQINVFCDSFLLSSISIYATRSSGGLGEYKTFNTYEVNLNLKNVCVHQVQGSKT